MDRVWEELSSKRVSTFNDIYIFSLEMNDIMLRDAYVIRNVGWVWSARRVPLGIGHLSLIKRTTEEI
jgi:hypothetical protein